jgi:hypothetical protein
VSRLDGLDEGFRATVEAVLDECRCHGVEMRVYEAVRDPWTQARYWRRSRTTEQIQARAVWLRDQGAFHLAQILEDVGPQHGRWATNALPGFSWHQWGTAVDAFWVVDGAANWSTSEGGEDNGYRVWRRVGLRHGLHIATESDWVHLQQHHAGRPQGTVADIDAAMRRKFPNPV